MAATFKEVFGAAIPPKFTPDMAQLPSPEDLKYKILIKTSVGKNTPRELINITHLEGGGGDGTEATSGVCVCVCVCVSVCVLCIRFLFSVDVFSSCLSIVSSREIPYLLFIDLTPSFRGL
jgi:hypothetical protein